MKEVPWVLEARKYIGTREIKGPQHNSVILRFWQMIKLGGIKDDETPWCASFASACLEAVGLRSTRSGRAKSYLDWGVPLREPRYGAVVVFSRDGGGHVGFIVGKTVTGDLLVLGGNQGDEVSVRQFSAERVVGYRWPTEYPQNPDTLLANGSAPMSRREA